MIIIECSDGDILTCNHASSVYKLTPKLKKGYIAMYEIEDEEEFFVKHFKSIKKVLVEYEMKEEVKE